MKNNLKIGVEDTSTSVVPDLLNDYFHLNMVADSVVLSFAIIQILHILLCCRVLLRLNYKKLKML